MQSQPSKQTYLPPGKYLEVPDGYTMVYPRPELSPTPVVAVSQLPPKIEEPKKEKESKDSLPIPKLFRSLRRTSRIARAPIRVSSTYSNTATGAANTELTAVLAVGPYLTVDWSSLSSLFDEVRVLSSTIHYYVKHNLSTVPVIHGMCYDPCDSSSLAVIDAALATPVHRLSVVPAVSTSSIMSPMPMNPTGFHKLHTKVSTDNTRSVSVGNNLAGGWMSTSDSSDVWGYWKFRSSAPSTGLVASLTYFLSIEMEFRSRQ